MNLNYGMLDENEKIVYADDYLVDETGIVTNPTEAQYHAAGWKTLNNMSYPDEPAGENMHWEENGYRQTKYTITKKWKAVEDPKQQKIYSKLYLDVALIKRGLQDKFDSFLDSTYVEGSNVAIRRLYDKANDLRDGNEMFDAYKDAAKIALCVDDDTMEAILIESEAR